MQILENFEIEGMYIRQSLLDNEFCLDTFWYRLLICWPIRNSNEIDIVLTAFQKIGKNTRSWLELLTSIFGPAFEIMVLVI